MAIPYPQVVLLGDSLLQRSVDLADGFSFQAALQTRYASHPCSGSSLPTYTRIGCIRRLDVVNRGLSGWNTANAMQYIDDIIPEPRASSPVIKYLVSNGPSEPCPPPCSQTRPEIVLFGANDAVIPLPTTSQHVPLDDYKRNLTNIITHPHVRAHKPKILLVTPPPIDEMKLTRLDTAEGHASAIRSFATSAAYSEKAREVAHENAGVILIDLWQALMDAAIALAPREYQPGGPWLGSPENGKAGGLEQLLPDGLHMSGDAYRVLFDQVRPHIGQEWTNLPGRDRTGFLFPDWLDLNVANAETKT